MRDVISWRQREQLRISSALRVETNLKLIFLLLFEFRKCYDANKSGKMLVRYTPCIINNYVHESGWIVLWRVPSCFDRILAVFKDFELKFSVCLNLAMLFMCSPLVFVAVSQKVQYKVKRGPDAKISVLSFSLLFSKQLSWNSLCDARRPYSYRPGEWSLIIL